MGTFLLPDRTKVDPWEVMEPFSHTNLDDNLLLRMGAIQTMVTMEDLPCKSHRAQEVPTGNTIVDTTVIVILRHVWKVHILLLILRIHLIIMETIMTSEVIMSMDREGPHKDTKTKHPARIEGTILLKDHHHILPNHTVDIPPTQGQTLLGFLLQEVMGHPQLVTRDNTLTPMAARILQNIIKDHHQLLVARDDIHLSIMKELGLAGPYPHHSIEA